MRLDPLDLLCLTAIIAWEAGSGRAVDPRDVLVQVGAGRWRPSAREAECLLRHRPGSLEWSELVLPALCGLLVEDAGVEWSVEALGHVARLLATRELELSVRVGELVARGADVDPRRTWEQLALAGFPSPDPTVLVRWR